MRLKVVDRRTALHVQAGAQHQAPQCRVIHGVTEEDIGNVPAVSVQNARLELVAEQIEHSRGEVEQRTDRRIALSVIVTERTLEVAVEFRDAIVGTHQPVLGERLVHLELDGSVLPNRVDETIRDTVRSSAPNQFAVLRRKGSVRTAGAETCGAWRYDIPKGVGDRVG